MRKPPRALDRRALLTVLPLAAGALLAGCTDEQPATTPGTDAEHAQGPQRAEEALELAELAPAPDGVQVELAEIEPAGDFELWSREIRFTAPAEAVAAWAEQSFGEPDLPGRAHVTPSEVKEAFRIEDVPDTWRVENVSVVGTPYERMVLIDDQDPRTVRIHLAEVRD